MAERIISPGVFTREIDQSFLPGAVAQIGAAIIGPTVKGPALVPTKVSSWNEFTSIFGSYTTDSYVPFAVKDYLDKGGNVITVTRLLYEDGYKLTNGSIAICAQSASTKIITHVLHPTRPVTTDGSTNVFQNSYLSDGGSGVFALTLSGSYSAGSDTAIGFSGAFTKTANISASIVSTANNYLTSIFGKSALSNDYPVYVQYENKTAGISSFADITKVTMSLQTFSNYEMLQDYNVASTPWITSQLIGSTTTYNLFKFHTLSHGTSVNYETKIGIQDIRTAAETADPDGYGSFSVVIRRVNSVSPLIVNSPYTSQDVDTQQDIVEIFENCNLNPSSPNYVVRKIGDRYQTINNSNELIISGDYVNISKYVRIEVDPGVSNKTYVATLIPMGFRSLTSPLPAASGSFILATSSMVTSATAESTWYGFDFTAANNLNYLAPIPTSGSNTGSNADFYLGNVNQPAAVAFPTATAPYTGSIQAVLDAGTISSYIKLSVRKFIVPFQGGFDGAKPNLKKYAGQYISNTNTFGFDCSTSTSTGTTAYNKAFTLLSNTDYYDMNLLLTPGLIDSLHSAVTSTARTFVTNRQDVFYVMDSNALTDSLLSVVNQVTSIDNNYTATYWPWLRIINQGSNQPLWVPPSTMIGGVLAYNDTNQAPWYAPAGLNRGGLTTVTDTYKKLSQSDRDTLYAARVNPIANFVQNGIVVFGQKTLQARPSALDRINVRRLLIEVKKFIASSTRYLVFEQNTNATRSRFLSIVNPYMQDVKARQGLYGFRVIMDQTNNTPDLIDQNILYGQIFLQPTRTAEFIIIDFNIQPTGAVVNG